MFDPKLPAPLVDVDARRELVESMKRLDTIGRRYWAQLFGMPHHRVTTVEEHHDYS
jgi:hypothetical protein